MPVTFMEKPAGAEREIAESTPVHPDKRCQASSNWVKEHAHLVNYRVEVGHKSGNGLHG